VSAGYRAASATNPTDVASLWVFGFDSGMQVELPPINSGSFAAMAVYDGDIGAVPLSAAVWLFGSGLIGLAAFAKRKIR